MFHHAIVRPPAANFSDGLTRWKLGKPDYWLARAQHEAYCKALAGCGVRVHNLPVDEQYPDSTFVEDTAILTRDFAVLTRPGAVSRLSEVDAITPAIQSFYSNVYKIEPPATLDGGDVCEADGHFVIGISERTNDEGARQFAAIVEARGYTSCVVDIRSLSSVLHLKSGIAYLGNNHLLIMEELAERGEFAAHNRLVVPPSETYGCNCVLVNDTVLVPTGFPQVAEELERRGYKLLTLDTSEFRKMDGGLSCLSLRF